MLVSSLSQSFKNMIILELSCGEIAFETPSCRVSSYGHITDAFGGKCHSVGRNI